MISWLRHLIGWVISPFLSREDLILENLALRQQLLTLRARRPRRRLSTLHKLFWIVLRRLWVGWRKPLILVTPRTVVGWHRAGELQILFHAEARCTKWFLCNPSAGAPDCLREDCRQPL